MSVLLLILIPALVLALLYAAGRWFFRFTFSRVDKPYDWEFGQGDGPIVLIRDRAFFAESGLLHLRVGSAYSVDVIDHGCKLLRHDCGKSEQFVEDWIELGIQGWNPFQVSNDCAGIKKKYGDRLTLDGAWDNVAVLGWTDDELMAELETYTKTFLPGGRFIFSASAGGLLMNDPHKSELIAQYYEAHVRNYYKQ